VRGLSFHGGLIGAVGAAYIYTRIKRIDFLSMLDLCSPGLAIAYGITRIGCFLNGCCYGVPTSLPWAVRFHIDGGAAVTAPSHPTQIYAMMASFVIFGLLTVVQRRRRFTGEVFTSYLAMYSIYRFFNEFLRKGVTADVAFAGLTQAQVVSLLVLAVSLVVLCINRRRALGAKR
jgi:phosphatidylglycerol:prolipoprotein diacylglycerol transferase